MLVVAAVTGLGLAGCSSSSQSTVAIPRDDAATAAGSVRSAESFVESIGVNVHTAFTDTAYADFAQVGQRLEELGVHHVRDLLAADEPAQYRKLRSLASSGIFSTLILGSPENGIEGLRRLMSTVEAELQGSVDAVEGPNEVDLFDPENWPERLRRYQEELGDLIKSSPRLHSTPLIGPSVGQLRHAAIAPNLEGDLDYGNIHSYPGGEPPERELPAYIAAAHLMSGSKPITSTETGYQTAVNSDGEHPPVSEAAEATYLPRLYLDYFANGVTRTFDYELVDEHRDPGLEVPESGFGLLHYDFTPKPAFTTLRNLIKILEDPGVSFSPRELSYTITGDKADLREVMLEKRDGHYYLALWRAGSVWDTETRSAIQPGSAPVELHVEEPLAGAEEMQPNVSSEPTARLPLDRGSVPVRVGTRVVIVELEPAPRGEDPTG